MVRPEIAPQLVGETVMKTLFTAINRQGVVFLWPVTIPPPDGKTNEWWRSSREAAELAIPRWIRVKADMSLGAYQMYEAEGQNTGPGVARTFLPGAPSHQLSRSHDRSG